MNNKTVKRTLSLIGFLFLITNNTYSQKEESYKDAPKEIRDFFVSSLIRISDPVLTALSENKLKELMPVEKSPHAWDERTHVTYLEAFGRTLAGMAPWLELGPDDTEEGKLREKYIQLALKGIKNAVDPEAKDYMNFTKGGQPLVDAAFFAEALIRAPNQLWARLDASTQQNVLKELKKTRDISPYYMNWLLFSATIEAALLKFEGKADILRLEYALIKHDEWYLGDGMYGDGPDFHWDYYNSYVIQPMILDILSVLKEKKELLKHWVNKDKFINESHVFLERAQRYAEVQERLISPEGTFPPIGRSLAYRCGAFQLLSQIALMQQLPDNMNPTQVRSALYTLIKKQMDVPGTFDENGWLTIGFYGRQKDIAEGYISTGSLYLCTAAFLVLGLPEQTPFWAAPASDWTQKSIWEGGKAPIDHAYSPNQHQKEEDWETIIEADSFDDMKRFKANWNYFYPWGTDHNGSARMYKSQIRLENNSLHLKASPVAKGEGKSTSPPHLAIKYHSGAVHAKHQIKVSKEYPEYMISGEFKAPTEQGTWPAFWLTAVDGWPPESDILEFKGDAVNWQNTFITPKNVTTIKRTIQDALENWHTYAVKLKYIDAEHASITYYIDGEQTGVHYTNFTNKPLWLIINLQMEGSSGDMGPHTGTSYFAKNVTVKRKPMNAGDK
ncbi:Endo-1-2C3-1-2C4-beta-glycanase ExsH [Mariniflexile rhizosphaerae]|uniref:DUF2264 domain-containing protein n=1 Tax=unclassified Mariniflexile TaxID=2643887 RepID=UPI000CC12DF6|nr:DUF2264 domain-containing protein [Mariniflexile sp. TRM1-10]AXP82068.1 Endo-1-2C3-1-2C4-beta-glycanase ExsH [Mariniflexile sp. TRM1-10]PLB20292.1 MAG: DUF2264 multi-domain protein [Flavobacteriaceae bacterium FS1-H7996/R]